MDVVFGPYEKNMKLTVENFAKKNFWKCFQQRAVKA